MAAQVMKMPEPSAGNQKVQRTATGDRDGATDVQSKSLADGISQGVQLKGGGASGGKKSGKAKQAGGGFEQMLKRQQGQGSPLPSETRDFMESRFGADFGGVRVHTDAASVQMNRDVGAKAFTHGKDVFFNSGRFNPGSSSGKELIAHELAHTIQQKGKVSKATGDDSESAVQKAEMSPSLTGEPMVQGFEIFEDAGKKLKGGMDWAGDRLEDGAEWVGDRVEDGVDWAGDRVEDLKDLGEDAFPEMVERLSPELAALMHDGSLGMIRDEIESGLEGWVESALGSTNIDEAVVGFQEDFSSIFTELQTATEDGGEDCQAFVGKLDGIRSVIERLSESDAVQNLQDVFSSGT